MLPSGTSEMCAGAAAVVVLAPPLDAGSSDPQAPSPSVSRATRARAVPRRTSCTFRSRCWASRDPVLGEANEPLLAIAMRRQGRRYGAAVTADGFVLAGTDVRVPALGVGTWAWG